MTLHIIKLCVGADDIDDLSAWQARLMQRAPSPYHHTRMLPKRADELMQGGSIYWVIRGLIQVRQPILEVKEIRDRSGRRACELIFDSHLVRVEPTPKRAFQGWRYLKSEDAPADLKSGEGAAALPSALQADLRAAMVW